MKALYNNTKQQIIKDVLSEYISVTALRCNQEKKSCPCLWKGKRERREEGMPEDRWVRDVIEKGSPGDQIEKNVYASSLLSEWLSWIIFDL